MAYTPVKPGTSKKMPRQHPAEQWEGHVGCVCRKIEAQTQAEGGHLVVEPPQLAPQTARDWRPIGLFTGNHSCV